MARFIMDINTSDLVRFKGKLKAEFGKEFSTDETVQILEKLLGQNMNSLAYKGRVTPYSIKDLKLK